MNSPSTNEREVVFFQYACSENDGLITLVEPESDALRQYVDRDCETLESIIWWTIPAEP